MKKLIFLVSFFVISIFIFGCTGNGNNQQQLNGKQQQEENRTKAYQVHLYKSDTQFTLDKITDCFNKAELHIMPQMDEGYPKLNNVKPKTFELLDGGIYLYLFNNNEELKQGFNQIQDANIAESKI